MVHSLDHERVAACPVVAPFRVISRMEGGRRATPMSLLRWTISDSGG